MVDVIVLPDDPSYQVANLQVSEDGVHLSRVKQRWLKPRFGRPFLQPIYAVAAGRDLESSVFSGNGGLQSVCVLFFKKPFLFFIKSFIF